MLRMTDQTRAIAIDIPNVNSWVIVCSVPLLLVSRAGGGDGGSSGCMAFSIPSRYALCLSFRSSFSFSRSYAPARHTCHRYRRFYRETRSRSRTKSDELNRDAFRGNAVRPFVKSGNVSRAPSLMTRNTCAHTCYVCTNMYVLRLRMCTYWHVYTASTRMCAYVGYTCARSIR